MPRREYTLIEQGVQPVFYAPLTNGDLTDHVSGASLLCDSRVSYSWDNNENCYKFTMASNLQSGCTFVADIKMVTSGSIQMPIMRYNNSFWPIDYSSYNPAPMSPNTWYRVCAIKDSDGTTGNKYVNGVFRETFNAAGTASLMAPLMLFYYPGWGSRCTFYLKNIYVFDVALTLQEVADL